MYTRILHFYTYFYYTQVYPLIKIMIRNIIFKKGKQISLRFDVLVLSLISKQLL